MKRIIINLKYFSIFCYLFIILMGQMIGMPFFCWLLFTAFNFGNIDQFFAILAIIGFLILISNIKKTISLISIYIDVLCFLLLASPVVVRLVSVPIELFNYIAFILPLALFIVFYLISLGLSIMQFRKNKNI